MAKTLRYCIMALLAVLLPRVIMAQSTDDNYHSDYQHGKAYGMVCDGSPHYTFSNKRLVLKGIPNQYRSATVNKRLNSTYYWIKASVRQNSGDETKAYGLVFNSLGVGNSNVFLVSSSGYYSIGSFEGGKFTPLCHWTRCEAVRPIGKDNILIVKCVDNDTEFYINDILVYSYSKLKTYGNNHGYILKDNIEISSGYLEIHTLNEKYNFPTDGEPIAAIDTKYSEIAPTESSDGRCLYFSRVSHPGNIGGDDDCDIWYSSIEGGRYSEPVHMPSTLNSGMINAVVKADSRTLYVEGTYGKDGRQVSSDGVTAFAIQDGAVSRPQSIEIGDFYNRNDHGTYTFSSDNKVLVMALERSDTYGGLDLYISFQKPDGSYTPPRNMGSVLNTSLNDGTPYISADDKVLYFSSYGHNGFGSADIFLSYREDDSWLKWSEPDNLGPKVNTTNWNAYFSIAADNVHAYYVSTDNADFTENIYRIELPECLRPVVGDRLEGTVENSRDMSPVVAKLKYCGETDTSQAVTNRQGGFVIRRSHDQKFLITATAPGYWPATVRYSCNPGKPMRIAMTPLELGTTVILHNVHFETAATTLTASSIPELETLRGIMQDNPKMKIQISGYAYPSGNPKELQELSENRAQKVKNYLTDHGISASRIVCKGFGGSHPVNDGSTEQDRGLNRRVEFTILSH